MLRNPAITALNICLLSVSGIMAHYKKSPPSALGLDVWSPTLAPTVKHARVNGDSWVDFSLPDSGVGGDVIYQSDDRLKLELAWYDIQTGKTWQSKVVLKATDLPTFGDRGKHASLSAELGPGADVTITSASQEVLTAIGNRDGNSLARIPNERERITIMETCGTQAPANDPIIAILKHGFDKRELKDAMESRDRAQARGLKIVKRCPSMD